METTIDNTWDLLKPVKKHEYLEIRITNRYNISDKQYYEIVNDFKYKNPTVIVRNGCQFFLKEKESLALLLGWQDGFFKKNCKICYGITLRECDDLMKINGSYEWIKTIRFVFLDIEMTSHDMPTEAQSNMLDRYVDYIISGLKPLGLLHPIIIHSGAGRHLLYEITPTKITDAKLRWYKAFIEGVKCKFDNQMYEVDNVKDLTRVFGLPGSINVKRGKKVFFIYKDSEINTKFKIGSKRKKKFLFVDDKDAWKFPEVKQSLEWKVITHPKLPIGDVHSYLLFALKLLLKARGITEYENLEDEMNNVRNTKHKLDPYKGTDNKQWSPGLIINWCKKHKEWCKQYNIEWQSYGNICKELMQKDKP